MSLVTIIVFSGCSGYFNFLSIKLQRPPSSPPHCSHVHSDHTCALAHPNRTKDTRTYAPAQPRTHARIHACTRKRKCNERQRTYTRHSSSLTHSHPSLNRQNDQAKGPPTDRPKRRENANASAVQNRVIETGGLEASQQTRCPPLHETSLSQSFWECVRLFFFFGSSFFACPHTCSRLLGSGPQVACCAPSLSHRHVSAIVSCQPRARAASLLFANVAHVVRRTSKVHALLKQERKSRALLCILQGARPRARTPSLHVAARCACVYIWHARQNTLRFHFRYIQHVPRTHLAGHQPRTCCCATSSSSTNHHHHCAPFMVAIHHAHVVVRHLPPPPTTTTTALLSWWPSTTHMLLCDIFLLHQPPPPLRSFHGGHPPRTCCCATSSSSTNHHHHCASFMVATPRAGCCAASSSRAPRGKVLGDHLTIRG
jgi:hypothetical protein